MIAPSEQLGGKPDDDKYDPLEQLKKIKEDTERVRDNLAMIDARCEVLAWLITDDGYEKIITNPGDEK
ncbi:MAG: hypothetical protein GY904_13700 [Planctomycetaceae bacterium]|nr:hypothetical protein [Planctomycetaceae bacterium]